jgi:hypothetical protein
MPKKTYHYYIVSVASSYVSFSVALATLIAILPLFKAY